MYRFESFVVGESNRMSYLTATKVAENPGTIFNPLYIFGGVGLGKTHLMQAIGNYIADSDVNNKILYVQANEYLEDYGKAIRDNNMKAFEEILTPEQKESFEKIIKILIILARKNKYTNERILKVLRNNLSNKETVLDIIEYKNKKLIKSRW